MTRLKPSAPATLATPATVRRKVRILTWVLLGVWTATSFGWLPFARALNFKVFDWDFSFWMAAQGSVLVFFLITVVYAWQVNRWERELPKGPSDEPPQ